MRPATCNSSRTATSPRNGAVAWCGQGGLCNASLSHEAKQLLGHGGKAPIVAQRTDELRLFRCVGRGWCRAAGPARQRVSEQDTTHVDDLCAAPGNAAAPNG